MSLEQENWDGFLSDLVLWRKAYLVFSSMAVMGNLMTQLALKHHIYNGLKKYSTHEDVKKREYFEAIFKEVQNIYTPDKDLNKLKNTLICLDINPESHLYLEHGKSICGIYIDMMKEPILTRLRNKETGEYEEKECTIVISLGYPNLENPIRLTFLDTIGMNRFI